MKYEQVWSAVDNLAKAQGLSPSGLAKKAGLDATTFNKSKRIRTDGKKRWPSLDSLNKVIEVSNITFENFIKLADTMDYSEISSAIPFIKCSENSNINIKNNSINTEDWNKISFPGGKENIYAIEIDSSLDNTPYNQNSTLIVSKNSDIRRGDKVVIFTIDNHIYFQEFVRRTSSTVEFKNISTENDFAIDIKDILIVNRILWVSQ